MGKSSGGWPPRLSLGWWSRYEDMEKVGWAGQSLGSSPAAQPQRKPCKEIGRAGGQVEGNAFVSNVMRQVGCYARWV